MAKVRIEVNRKGVSEILKDHRTEALCMEVAERVAATAGEGMEASSQIGARRARASVITATFEARLAEAQGRALSRAVESGRG